MTCPSEDCLETWHQSLLGLGAWVIETDTDPAICEAILLTLEDQDPTKSFATFSNPRTLRAAQAKDWIGWLHTTEGKSQPNGSNCRRNTTGLWIHVDSRQSPGKWAAGLITNLLSVTHSQWLHWYAVLHERDVQGLESKQGRDLLAAIQNQLVLGLEGLHVRDHHYITCGNACILALPAANKQAWLSGILIARETYLDSEAREMGGMQNCMLHWLAQG
jgi:hypothetical protein